ncbi:GatB/YqeY domain-containing protein [Paludisphaera mucosa]|uniref:GatB/YqeY domain-containing protein n=1 Tax=Paludisphaera mucosa TaxID=3030827 RepID=A0ABT6F965_9BACT|nr:GatB/YqeY domain-containing protein [Paludisphaera mucosa]MDG3003925.1 GatB/YqeY domain-containing protein [Paludisphaera mucosa]
MTIVQKMRAQLVPAMKARDAAKLAFLRYWIAQLTLGTGAEMEDAEAVKKMRSVLKEAKSGVTTFTAEELELLREWVPASLGPDQILEALAPAADQIRAAAKDGMALGVAMKALAGRPVETEDVKAAVAALRSQP